MSDTIPDEITSSNDYIDTRDVINRIEYLKGLGKEADGEEKEELGKLSTLISDLRDQANESPEDGIFLIRDSYFEDYAREKPSDWYSDYDETRWPFNCIDWSEAVVEFRQDYTEIEFDGETFWFN